MEIKPYGINCIPKALANSPNLGRLSKTIPYNPADRTHRPKCEKYNASFYNKEELMELFRVFEGDRMELCVHIAAYYGLRRSEVVGLKWDAVDF